MYSLLLVNGITYDTTNIDQKFQKPRKGIRITAGGFAAGQAHLTEM